MPPEAMASSEVVTTIEAVLVARGHVVAQQQLEAHGLRELRGPPKPPHSGSCCCIS